MYDDDEFGQASALLAAEGIEARHLKSVEALPTVVPAVRVAIIMAKRLHKTLLDYLVIAISPAMIIVLVDSLVLFLIEVFYRGNFEGRLEYVFTLFVIGAVLIGRISIEEGRERAVLFAVPLGIAILLAICKFVEFQGRRWRRSAS